MVDGIVLAGGFSSRIGKNKMNIMFQGKAVIRHTIEQMQSVCQHVYVVTGFYHDEIKKIINDMKDVEIVYNEMYEKGMFTSIKKGVACTKHDFFIIPGDYPLVGQTVYQKLLLGAMGIRVPSFSFKLGHPIFFKKYYKSLILSSKKKHLKAFRDQYEFEMIDVNQPGILFDIDTVDDVKKLKTKE